MQGDSNFWGGPNTYNCLSNTTSSFYNLAVAFLFAVRKVLLQLRSVSAIAHRGEMAFLLHFVQVLFLAGQTVSPLSGQVDRPHLRQLCDFGTNSLNLARAR